MHVRMQPLPPKGRRMTRIVATIGPATSSVAAIRALVAAGMDVARLNMSHGDPADHARVVRRIRRVARASGRPVGIMADLQGPKVRLGDFPGPIRIEAGQRVVLTTSARAFDPARRVVPVDYRYLPVEADAGQLLLVADGAVRLRVRSTGQREVDCEVLEGHELAPRAGLSLPDAKVVRSPLTPKDRADLAWAIEQGVDFIALSFVRRARDLHDARRLIRRFGGDQLLIAKIETRPAVAQLEDVLGAADAVMVARGDLGVELPPERVPIEQKRIIEACNAAGKPVITATQMLESMRRASRPTRAEASDVANAVLDGTWAVMLSAETATGDYPVESVRMLDAIAREAERLLLRNHRRRAHHGTATVAEAIAGAGAAVAFEVGARALVALTRSGATAIQVARSLPHIPAYAYTSHRRTLPRMTLYRGITPRYLPEQRTLDHAVAALDRDLVARRDIDRGDVVVVLGGAAHEPAGTTTRVIVHTAR